MWWTSGLAPRRSPVTAFVPRAIGPAFTFGLIRTDPELIEIDLFEAPGVQLGAQLQSALVRHFSRQEFRRAGYMDIGRHTKTAQAVESFVEDLVGSVDAERIRERGFRLAVEYSHAVPALVAPLVLGALGVEVIASRAEVIDQIVGEPPLDVHASTERARQLVGAVRADLAVVVDSAGERVTLIDDRGRVIEHWQALLLLAALIGRRSSTETIVVPSTTTSHVERVSGDLQVERVGASLAALTLASTGDGVVFAGTDDGTYVFPRFLPAPTASASIAMLLDLLVADGRAVGELVDELPHTSLAHVPVACPWNAKGALMRLLADELKDEDLSLGDGIRVNAPDSWAQVIPDPDEPIVHLYAEATSADEVGALEQRFVALIERIVATVAQEPAGSASARVALS